MLWRECTSSNHLRTSTLPKTQWTSYNSQKELSSKSHTEMSAFIRPQITCYPAIETRWTSFLYMHIDKIGNINAIDTSGDRSETSEQPVSPFQHPGQRSHVDAWLCALHTPGENSYNPESDFRSKTIACQQHRKINLSGLAAASSRPL